MAKEIEFRYAGYSFMRLQYSEKTLEFFECQDCFALVTNQEDHKKWHNKERANHLFGGVGVG